MTDYKNGRATGKDSDLIKNPIKPSPEALLADMKQANGEALLVKSGDDCRSTGDRPQMNRNDSAAARCDANVSDFAECEYALFTGCNLGAYEPELVVKLYDSLRFQNPDTGVILMCCGFAAQMAGDNDAYRQALNQVREAWNKLGKPKLICSCPTCLKTLKKELPEITTVSLYDLLIELGISGGCHEETYCIRENADSKEYESIKALAEDMGATIVAKPDAQSGESPYLTCNISVRNMLKSQGKEAVHILELIYGMGDSNAHMVHEHKHEHEDEDDNCATDCNVGSEARASSISASLPSTEQKWKNRIELKEAMLSLFW